FAETRLAFLETEAGLVASARAEGFARPALLTIRTNFLSAETRALRFPAREIVVDFCFRRAVVFPALGDALFATGFFAGTALPAGLTILRTTPAGFTSTGRAAFFAFTILAEALTE